MTEHQIKGCQTLAEVEEWRPYIYGYEASSFGRIRSLDRKIKGKNGHTYFKRGRLLTGTISDSGYITVSINGKAVRAHRVVCCTFIPNPENKPCVNHKNMVKTDNRVINLEWSTPRENTLHCFSIKGNIGLKYFRQDKLVLNLETGIYYDSCKDAGESIKMDRKALSARLRGRIVNKTNFIYV